jgi:aminoglycoside phosphotransferase (APT) family kinase protein
MQPSMLTGIEQFVARASGARSATVRKASLLSGGAIQENWLVEFDLDGSDHHGLLRTVVRTDAPSAVSLSHSRAQEFILLKTVFDAGVTVPEPLWLCEDRGVIGRHFFVMRCVGGTASGHLLVKDGPGRDGLARRLGQELARIHAVKPPVPALDFLPSYSDTPAQHLVGKFRAFLDQHRVPYPVLEWGLRWLERHAPPAGRLTLCHRDFRTGNYMVDDSGLTGILDWEFAGWSDPLEDIGWFCAKCWRFGTVGKEAGGIGLREDFYRGYEEVSGLAIDRPQVRYWEVMAHLNWAVIAIQQAERHVSGEENSLLLALTGHIVPELEWEILNMTEQT